jgi:type IV secretion system protein TrbL
VGWFDTGIFTLILEIFLEALGDENIVVAIKMFTQLLSIEICLFGIAIAFGKADCSEIFYKTLIIAGYLYFIQNYGLITEAMFDFFSETGIKIGGSSLSLSSDFLMDPSSIMKTGWKTSFKIWILDSPWDYLKMDDNIFRLICSIIIIIAFFIIMLSSIFRVLEFYLITTMSLIIFPFGIIGFFKYLSENCIGNLFKMGMKLMTFTLICSLSLNIFENNIADMLSSDPSLAECISCSMATVVVCILIWKVPELASGLVSGNPSINASGAAKGGAKAMAAIASKGASKAVEAIKRLKK